VRDVGLRNTISRFLGLERKSLANPSCDLLELIGAVPTAAGVTMSAETALRVPAIAAAVRSLLLSYANPPRRWEAKRDLCIG
jgi:hypothetical protein